MGTRGGTAPQAVLPVADDGSASAGDARTRTLSPPI